MLWTDRDWVTPADLLAIDREIYDVAEADQLLLRDQQGGIHQGIAEAAIELSTMLDSYGGQFSTGGISGSHLAAVHNVGIAGYHHRPQLHLGQICVSNDRPGMPSAIVRWAQHYVLAYVYRQASMTKVDDRHERKLAAVTDGLTRKYKPWIYNEGVPAIINPLAAPGALWERGTGTWDQANITTAAGGAAAELEVDVAISYVGADYVSQTDPGNAESAISELVRVVIPASEEMTIDITALTPLDAQHPATSYATQYTPMVATGWNVWAGLADRELYLQNPSPIAIATKTYGPVSPTLSGTQMWHEGQWPDAKFLVQRVAMRA